MTYETTRYSCSECNAPPALVLVTVDGGRKEKVGIACACTESDGTPFIALGDVHGGLPESWSRVG